MAGNDLGSLLGSLLGGGGQSGEALPDDTLRKAAAEAGVSPQEAADEIARSLPQAVDRLTPDGSLPEGGSLEEIIRRQQL
ncbi:YidB family protein [Streptomyces wedmorensis]|uniref:YidB family protein n=1 Tax=Streptomyces wedmorensis TaxID=43759 RepID=UPI00342D89F2